MSDCLQSILRIIIIGGLEAAITTKAEHDWFAVAPSQKSETIAFIDEEFVAFSDEHPGGLL